MTNKNIVVLSEKKRISTITVRQIYSKVCPVEKFHVSTCVSDVANAKKRKFYAKMKKTSENQTFFVVFHLVISERANNRLS